jgi:protein-tyrosine kinase
MSTAHAFHMRSEEDFFGRTLHASTISPAAVEQYRSLALSLEQAPKGPHGRAVVITSALPGEGKTLTCANLGVTLAGSFGRKVLLVDADLRRPALHRIFTSDLPAATTKTPLKVGDGDGTELTVTRVSTRLTTVTLGGSVVKDPVRALQSDAFRELIDRARRDYEWVLIDSPPSALVPDPSILAQLADGVLLVVLTAQTPLDAIHRGVASIGKGKILGVVLNRAPESAGSAYPYYDMYLQRSPEPKALTDGRR